MADNLKLRIEVLARILLLIILNLKLKAGCVVPLVVKVYIPIRLYLDLEQLLAGIFVNQ